LSGGEAKTEHHAPKAGCEQSDKIGLASFVIFIGMILQVKRSLEKTDYPGIPTFAGE
jgi:hypothetical protein